MLYEPPAHKVPFSDTIFAPFIYSYS